MMNKFSLVFIAYALILFFGGLMGYIKANSMVSLIVSSAACFIFLLVAYFVQQKSVKAFNLGIHLLQFFTFFFLMRGIRTMNFFPAAPLCLLSIFLFLYFQKAKEQFLEEVEAT